MKTGMCCRSLLAVLTLFLLVSGAFAQYNYWDTENGLSIRQGRHITYGMNSMADDGQDHFVLSWADARRGTMDVYAQLYNSSGEPLWAEQDVLVAGSCYPEQDPKVIHTSDNGWIIAWTDYENDYELSGVGDIYLQKLNNQGNAAWSEPVGPIGSSLSYISHYKIYPTDDGGVLLAWLYDFTTHVQRFSQDGTPLWEEPVLFTNHEWQALQVTPGPDGGIVFVGHDTFSDIHTITAQKMSASGEYLWPGEETGITLASGSLAFNARPMNPVILSNGDVLFAWYEWDSGDLKGVKVADDGSTPWGTTLQLLVDNLEDPYRYDNTLLAGDVVVFHSADEDYHSVAVDCSGDSPTVAWTTPTLEIERPIDFTSDVLPDGRINLSWVDDVTRFMNICINTDGSFASSSPRQLGNWAYMMHFGTCLLGDQYITTWTQPNEHGSAIVMQKQSASTSAPLLSTPAPLEDGITSFTGGPVIKRVGNRAFVAWIDMRSGIRTNIPYYQVVDWHTGDIFGTQDGVPLVPFDPQSEDDWRAQYDLQVLEDDEDGVCFFWSTEQGEGDPRIWGQRVNASGDLCWSENGRILVNPSSEMPYGFDKHKVIRTQTGHFAVVGVARISPTDPLSRVFVNWFDSDGTPLLDEPIMLDDVGYSEVTQFHVFPAEGDDIVFSIYEHPWGNDPCYLTYGRVNAESGSVWLQREEINDRTYMLDIGQLCESGDLVGVLWNNEEENEGLYLHRLAMNGILDFTLPGNHVDTGNMAGPCYAKVDKINGSIHLAAYTPECYRYYHIGYDGSNLLVEPDGISFVTDRNPESMMSDGGDGIFIFFTDRGDPQSDIYFTHLRENGEVADESYGEIGVPLVDAWFSQRQLYTEPDGEGGFVAVWNDWRGSLASEPEDDIYAAKVNDLTTSAPQRREVQAPKQWRLDPAYPNPFNPSTTLRYTVPRSGKVRLAIYDVLGREVATLVDGQQNAGYHRIVWQAKNGGVPLASGAYFVRYDTPAGTVSQRILLLK